jgi:hypothetical protein
MLSARAASRKIEFLSSISRCRFQINVCLSQDTINGEIMPETIPDGIAIEKKV